MSRYQSVLRVIGNLPGPRFYRGSMGKELEVNVCSIFPRFRFSAFLLSLPLLLSSSSRVSTHDARQIRISIADSPSLPVLAVSWRISVSLPLDLFRAPISRSDGQPSKGCPAFAASTRLPWNRKATPGSPGNSLPLRHTSMMSQ